MRRPISIAVKMMAVIGVVASCAMGIFAMIVLTGMERHFQELDRLQLEEVRATFLSDSRDPAQAVRHITRENPQAAVVFLRDGRVVVQSTHAPADGVCSNGDTLGDDAVFIVQDEGHVWRALKSVADGGVLYSLVPMDVHLAFHASLRMKLLAAFLALLALVLFAVWRTVKSGLAPVQELARRINEVTADKMETPVEPATVAVELSGFAAAFNRLLARLSEVISRQRQFSADIAHELKTPVTNLTVQTEVALARPRSNEELENILYSSLEEYRRLSKMIEDMLFLARIDNSAHKREMECFEVVNDIADLADFFSDWADEQGVAIDVEGSPVYIVADRLMIRRAVTNLITNAAKHTASGGRVTIRVTENFQRRGVVIAISNPGKPIPPEHLPHLFERFYRADASRNRQDGGTGIGLAMVDSIARFHGGGVSVASDTQATVFTMTIPSGVMTR